MYRRCLFFLLIGLMLNFNLANTQDSTPFRFFENYRGDGMLAYNFFTGEDAADFATSIDGFGSGLIDLSDSRISIDVVTFGSEKINLSLGVGLSVMKYRLSNHLVFTNPGGGAEIQYAIDPDATHDYQDTFFGWGKSKIIAEGAYIPLNLNVTIGKNLIVTAGPYADFNMFIRYKTKYMSGEDRVKEVIRSKEFRKMNLSTFKYGVSAGLYHKKWKVGISGTYCFAPFFKPGLGPDLHEARVTATFRIINIKEMLSQSLASIE